MGTGVGEAMLIGAVTGAGTSAITGGDPIKGALLGAAGGGIGAGAAGATTGATSGTAAGTTSGTAAGTTSGTAAAGTQASLDATLAAANTLPSASAPLTTAGAGTGGAGFTGTGAGTTGFTGTGTSATGLTAPGMPPVSSTDLYQVGYVDPLRGSTIGATTPSVPTENPMFPSLNKLATENPIAYPAGAGALANLLAYQPEEIKEEDEYDGALSRFSYSPENYVPYRVASGGLMDTAPARRLMGGGQLGSYSDGGQALKGPGDGMSDSIPGVIGGTQPARLADGEFVVPADVVSGIGNGSTDAGAKQLYSMMDKVREARTGRTSQAPEINPRRMMPA